MTLRFTNTLGGKARGVHAARGRPRPHVQLRADRLRPRPRRQLPRVPAGRPRQPLPALVRLQRDVGDEHHRRRRSDHPRPRGRGRHARRADRAAHRALRRRHRRAAHRSARRPVARHRAHPGDGRASSRTLVDKGHAYVADDGSIFFRISTWPGYGTLAKLDPEQARVDERVAADDYGKDDVRDFAAVEGPQAGRAVVGHGGRARAARAGTSSARR